MAICQRERHLQDQEADHVAEGNLRQHVDQLKLEAILAEVREQVAERDQYQRAPADVPEQVAERRALSLAARKREGHCDADHEREAGLDQIPERDAGPCGVLELIGQPPPVRVRGERRDAEPVRDQHEHDEPAIGVEGQQALGGPWLRRRNSTNALLRWCSRYEGRRHLRNS